ncbi:glutathione peroxidase, partial [Phocaeicola vulgatus]
MFAHKYLLFFFRRTKIMIFSRQSFL